ncbi:MAG: GntR family transcriptional regulator [Methanobacterium sp.]
MLNGFRLRINIKQLDRFDRIKYSCTITNNTSEGGLMWFDVDPRSSTPIYLQLVQGIKEAIARGVLQTGDRLPTVRDLASEIRINPNTIAKAYARLEQEGLIETMRSRGTFVAAGSTPVNLEQRYKKLAEHMQAMLVEAYHMGISQAELERFIMEHLRDWEQQKEGK